MRAASEAGIFHSRWAVGVRTSENRPNDIRDPRSLPLSGPSPAGPGALSQPVFVPCRGLSTDLGAGPRGAGAVLF